MSNEKIITLHLHCNEPLFIQDASAGEAHIDKNGYVRSGKPSKSIPVARTEKKPILIPKELSGRDTDSITYFPYIKANNMIGRLRRFAQDIIDETLKERGLTISDKTYRGLSCGATSGTPSGIEPTLSEYRTARNHFYMGLFGGGNGMFSSGMSFGDLNVKHKQLVSVGVLPTDLTGVVDVQPEMLTYPIAMVRRDRMLELSDYNIEQVVKGGNEAIEAWREKLILAEKSESDSVETGEKLDKEKVQDGKRQKLRNLVSYECSLAGLGYFGKIVMRPNTHNAHVGLLIESLSKFAESNAIGGKSSKGLGRFNLTVKEGDNVLLQSINGEIVASNADKYADALAEELENLDLEELESFFQ